ncbi:vascular endothelial growth factor A-like isoform X4 [Dicentrarchus labrax]|uniref:vascular endothelial growth factor A-like isoform X4 n=1 Tax=Dicentrarchus labrax TaxID=13489 RepID=UPI0021F6252F|nr:vascular endothelial growth factor A-like isoform X4 [Dicentrarchus labrax]
MQSFTGISHLLLALLLQRAPAQISHPPEEGHPKVMEFQEVWAKSMCRAMEQLVDVEQEYPGLVEHIYLPACVPLWRCSGCCGDENLECQPTLERNITLEVKRIQLRTRQRLIHKRRGESIKNRPRRRKHKKTTTGCGKCQFP